MSGHELDRVDELLVDRALWGLDDEEERELDRMVAERGDGRAVVVRGSAWDTVTATIAATLSRSRADSVPASLTRRLREDAVGFWFARHDFDLDDLDAVVAPPAPVLAGPVPRRDGGAPGAGSFWTVAIAVAALLVASLLWATRPPTSPSVEQQARQLARQADLRLAWNPVEQNVSGEVLWSQSEQRGFLRFEGLQSNDRSVAQYQLWVFDGERSLERPVDGGVFDMPAGRSDLIVPIDAKIKVHRAIAFAVTREKPSGVVVSDRDYVVATAGL